MSSSGSRKRTIRCPYCSKAIESENERKDVFVLRSHANRSLDCNEKRSLLGVSNVSRVGKISRIESDLDSLDAQDGCFEGVTEERESMFDACSGYAYWHDDDCESSSHSPFADDKMHLSSSSTSCTYEDGLSYLQNEEIDTILDELVEVDELKGLLEEGIRIINGSEMEVDKDSSCEVVEDDIEDVRFGQVPLTGSRLTKRECGSNDIKLKQDLINLFFFENMPAKFNRVCGEEVNEEIAIQFLSHIVDLHMSESEADDFLALMDRVISSQTGKFFPMPIRSKTLRRAFLGKADQFFPLEEVNISILPELFQDGDKHDLSPLCKPMIKVEDALALLFLKMNPNDLTKESRPVFEEVNGETQRVYNGFCSGDYPIDIQKLVYEEYGKDGTGRLPLILYFSLWIDSGLMNSTHTRSTTPIVITALNDSSKNSELLGFCAKSLHITDEELDQKLDKKGLKSKSSKQELKKLALRQANWDYINSIIGSFQGRQKESRGFDVQIGLGPMAQYHKVHIVLSNCCGDHPQIHEMTGIKSNACHICKNMFPFNFPISDFNRDAVGSIHGSHPVRDPLEQYVCALRHYQHSLAAVKLSAKLKSSSLTKEEKVTLTTALKTEKAKLKESKELVDQLNSRSGDISPYLLFKDYIRTGIFLFFWCD